MAVKIVDILTTIDELNQFKNGFIKKSSLIQTLEELLRELKVSTVDGVKF
jgi:hypothetical protein|tara:strand:- start:918 stop:1067 length:150 start_codon:yes stop_codon:yes gene_type:complete